MDYSQFLQAADDNAWDLYENYDGDHPEALRRKEIDDNIKKGMSPVIGHEKVCGHTDLKSTESKSRLAATLARLQRGSGPRTPEAEEGSGSIYAQDKKDTQERNGKQWGPGGLY